MTTSRRKIHQDVLRTKGIIENKVKTKRDVQKRSETKFKFKNKTKKKTKKQKKTKKIVILISELGLNLGKILASYK